MAQAPSLREDRSKGTQRTRKLSTVNAPWMLEKCEGTLQGVAPWRRTAGVEPGAVQGCAAGRGTESLTQSREVRRETAGPSDSPEGARWRGQEHVGKAGEISRRVWSRPARPA